MIELTLRRLFALPEIKAETETEACVESIRFEDLATRTVVLKAKPFGRLPQGSHVWVGIDGKQRRLPVRRDERGRMLLRVTVTRNDAFADALAFRTRAGDRVTVSPNAPRG